MQKAICVILISCLSLNYTFKHLKTLIYFLCGILLLEGCKKSDTSHAPTPQYTIKGRIYISYPTTPYAKQSITLRVTRGANDTYVDADLGTTTTDDSGKFSIQYNQTSISGPDPGHGPAAQIHIFTQFLTFDNIPVNQNVNQDFYNVTNGKLQIYLYTNKPLETNHDTLFLGHFSNGGNNLVIDTITQNINGLWKTSKPTIGGYTLFYGRGWKDFKYNPSINGFPPSAHYFDVVIHGDPTIDKMTINY